MFPFFETLGLGSSSNFVALGFEHLYEGTVAGPTW